MALKKRRLGELYQVGKMLTFDDGEGEAVQVYLRKLNTIDMEKALRQANGARAAVLAARKDIKSSAYMDTKYAADLQLSTKTACISLLAEKKVAEKRGSVEAEVQDEEEWSKEGYLQGLWDAWSGGLNKRDVEQDPEAKRVLDELNRYEEQVKKVLDGYREEAERDFTDKSPSELYDLALDVFFDRQADLAWFSEIRRSEVFMAVRDPDEHGSPYFESREEVDQLATPVIQRLQEEYQTLTVDVMEGKDSRPTEDSSKSSAPSEAVVTSNTSGPVAVPA
jgi:hypothetical protein